MIASPAWIPVRQIGQVRPRCDSSATNDVGDAGVNFGRGAGAALVTSSGSVNVTPQRGQRTFLPAKAGAMRSFAPHAHRTVALASSTKALLQGLSRSLVDRTDEAFDQPEIPEESDKEADDHTEAQNSGDDGNLRHRRDNHANHHPDHHHAEDQEATRT
jgi:hypothetical protein